MSAETQGLANLDAWLATMRQAGGYGGPVPHWWESCFRYVGPGIDWRYEGLLAGYATLYARTQAPRWQQRLGQAAADVLAAQRPDGSLLASRFEGNPGTLGTPHEAAAAAGLLAAHRVWPHPAWRDAAGRVLDNLVAQLWDPVAGGFNDRPHHFGRVPNKLATLADALLQYAEAVGSERHAAWAAAALADVLRLQVRERGRQESGAVHQMEGPGGGDRRFFPYYNARIVPALLLGAEVLGHADYREAAEHIGDFLTRVQALDGGFPQVVYAGGAQALTPRWIAGSADILRALALLDRPVPPAARQRLLAGQLPTGGFRTAEGFGIRSAVPDFRDVTPAVGWNDKVLRWLAEAVPVGGGLPSPHVGPATVPVTVRGRAAVWREPPEAMTVESGRGDRGIWYQWRKRDPWATGIWEVLAG